MLGTSSSIAIEKKVYIKKAKQKVVERGFEPTEHNPRVNLAERLRPLGHRREYGVKVIILEFIRYYD